MNDLTDDVAQACRELESRLRAGVACSADTLLDEFPSIKTVKESALEIIYTEYVIRRELGQDPCPSFWIERFPQWRTDLEELFEVHSVLGRELQAGAPGPPDGTLRELPIPPEIRGQRIGQYEIIDEIAHGGMGVVYRARQAGLDRVVALKMILSPQAGLTERIRFRTEAEATARLQHPNIISVYEVGEHDDCPYLSMEYVDGVGVDREFHEAPLSAVSAAELVRTLAEAVQYAHQKGIIHRDLKPANVLRTREGTPKITDFGLAKRVHSESLDRGENGVTQAGHILGTPSYMAPEQIGAEEISPSVDIYALGVILYESVTGRVPFCGDTLLETLELVRTQEPLPPIRLRPKLPRDLETICLKCLEKDPGRRYGTAADLAEDLGRFLNGEVIRARRIGVAERSLKWVRRHPAISSLSAGFAATVFLSFAAVTWKWIEADDARGRTQTALQAESDQRAQLERLLYFHEVMLASREYELQNTTRAKELLDGTHPEFRHWEWKYFNRLCSSDRTLNKHSSTVRSVSFSPDGKLVASCSGAWGTNKPGEVIVCDARDGKARHKLGHSGSVMGVAFSPDGQLLASAGVDWIGREGEVKIWNMARGELRCSLPHDSFDVEFSPDGAHLAVGCANGRVRIVETATWAEVATIEAHKHNCFSISFNPAGTLIASGGRDGAACVWEVSSGKQVLAVEGLVDVRQVALSPDDRLLAIGTYSGAVRLWDVTQQRQIGNYQTRSGPASSIDFSPDGRWVSVTTAGGSEIWQVKDGSLVRRVRGQTGWLSVGKFSPDGRQFATAGSNGILRVRDLDLDGQSETFEVQGPYIAATAFSSDGRWLALASKPRLSSRGRYSDQKYLRVWDWRRRRTLRVYKGHQGWLTCVAISPDDQIIATGSEDKTVRLWDANEERLLFTLEGHSDTVTGVSFMPDGQVISGSEDGTLKFWDAGTGRLLETAQADVGGVTGIAVSALGVVACGGGDGAINVFSLATRRKVFGLRTGTSTIRALAFTPRGDCLASTDADAVIRIWNLESDHGAAKLSPSVSMKVHAESIGGLGFSPDGKRLASVTSDMTVRLWDVATGHQAARFTVVSGSRAGVQFSPDGRCIVVTEGSRLTTWDCQVAHQNPEDRALSWHKSLMRSSRQDRQWFATAFHLTQLIALQPDYWGHFSARAVVYARLSEWGRVEEDLETADRLGADRFNVLRTRALARLSSGDIAGYRVACGELARIAKDDRDSSQLNSVAWYCSLSPSCQVDRHWLVSWSQEAVAARRSSSRLNTLGAALFRAGRFKDAIGTLQEAIELRGNGGSAFDWIFLAMAHHGLGRSDEAGLWLRKAVQWIDQATEASEAGRSVGNFNWTDEAQLGVLRNEATEMISGENEAVDQAS